MEALLERAMKATPKGRGNWTPYRHVYFTLINQRGFSKKEACEWIANQEEMSEKDGDLLYMASKSWKEGSR